MPGRRWIPYAVVGFASALVYARTVGFPFVFDDRHLIVNNVFLREPWSPLAAFAHHFWHGTPFGAAYYRPIVVSSLALNGRLLGWGPAGFHLINVLLHAVNAGLVLALARRLGRSQGSALGVALLFACHPVAAWPVASIVARVDLLAALFVLLAWLAMETHALLVGLFFLLALLSKESALAFLVVPLLGLRRIKGGRPAWPALAASGFAVLSWLLLRRSVGIGLLPDRSLIDPLTNPLAQIPLPTRLRGSLALAGRYLLYLAIPVRFSDPVNYFNPAALPGPLSPAVLLPLAALLAWIACILALWVRRDRIAWPLAFSLASFLPASNILVPISSLYAQNFLYLPLVGSSLALGDVLDRPAARRVAVSSVTAGWRGVFAWRRSWLAGGALLTLAALSSLEAGIWRNNVALFSAWIERFPGYPIAHSALGVSFLERGEPARAIGPLRDALTLTDRSTEAHYNLAVALLATSQEGGSAREALEHLQRSLELSPDLAPARTQASRALLLLHRPSEAEREAREALRLTPGFTPAMIGLAEALYQQSRYREAADLYDALVRLSPADAGLRSRQIQSLQRAGEQARAEDAGRDARRLIPGFRTDDSP